MATNKKRTNITISDETKERLLQWGYENHVSGGLSGAIEALAWSAKVKHSVLRGQEKMDI